MLNHFKSFNMKWTKLYLTKYALLFTLLLVLGSCTNSSEIEERNWQLVWADDFEGPVDESPNASNWVYDLGNGPDGDGWGNAELQTYTNKSENVSLDGEGNLAITALNNGGFTSARIKTLGIFDQAFGRFEARIKLPYGRGLWPAFWLMGANIETVGWPQCGEIDVMELFGHEPNIIHGSLHGPGYSKEDPITKTFGFENDRFDLAYHIFAIEWDEHSINYFVDNVLYQQITPDDVPGEWVFDKPFFILLNVAVGGNSAGFPAIDTPFPQKMLVDYVKVYQEVK